MSPKTETTYEEYIQTRQGDKIESDVTYQEYMSGRFPDDTFEALPESVTRVEEVSPEDERKQIEDIIDWSDAYEENILTMQQLYEPVSQLIKSIPDPKDVNIEVQELEGVTPRQPSAIKAAEGEEKGIANTFLGFKYPPKPPDWDRASLIEKFNFITLPVSDFLGRVGGKIASDWRMMKKEDVQKLLVSDLSEDLEWYQKSPEVVGWTAEKVAEFIAIKGVMKASGLHKALTVAGQKLAAPFIAKEITTRGGMKTVSTMSAAGIKGLVRKGMASFLTAAPENVTFISSWSALDAVLKGEPVGEAAVSGAGWGLALTAGLTAIGALAGAPEMKIAFSKAVQNVSKRYPGFLDKFGKPVTKEIEKEWLAALKKRAVVGKDVRLIDLAKRERQMFRNAIRAAEKEIIKAAEKEAALKAYWSSRATAKATAEAAKAAKPKVKVDIKTTETADKIELDHIIVPKVERGKGLGTRAMNDLIDHADEVGKRIELTVAKPSEAVEKPPSKPVEAITKPKAVEGPVDTLSEWVRLNREIDGTLKEMQKVSGQARETLRDKLGSLQAERNALDMGHKVREMTPEEIAEDEEFHAIAQDILNAGPDKANAALDILERRIGLLTKVSEGILTQEEADTLTAKFVAAAKARIPEPQRKQVPSREIAPTPTEAKADKKIVKFYEKFGFEVVKPDDPRITGIRMAREPDPDMRVDKTLEKTGDVALDDTELKPIVGQAMPRGIVDISNVGAIKQAYNTSHDWMLTFGRAKREDPELYEQLMKAYGKRNAGIENALDQVDKILPKTIKISDDVNMAIVYEDKRLSIEPEQAETYEKFKTLLDEMSVKQQEEGLFAKPFNERMIEENNIKIDKLTEELKHPNKSKRIAELRAENKILAEMRYLPHSVVVKRVIESKINTLSGDKKKAYLDRLSAFYKKRKGRLFLKDYLESGLITKDDMRMSRLAIEEVADYYIRSAYKGLYDYGKEKGYVQPFSDELHDEGWLTANELGISSPELKDQIIHPLFGSSLAEMKSMRQGRGSLANQLFGMVKQGQFIKPTIVWIYDGVQKYMRGMYSLNPVTEAKSLARATRSVIEKDELYHKLNESNLFQFPYEISKGARDEEIAKFINQHSAELDRVTKALEKITDTRWLDPDMTLGKMIRNIAMAAHRGMGQLTWAGDRMQRTQSYLILRKMGYSHDEAVKVAANSHGGYSLLSESYKKFMTKKTFVYSFRFLMPLEMGKTITEPIIAAKDSMGGKKIPKAHWERMVKAVIGTAVIPIATDEYMKWRGFEIEGKHLGPLAWKWRKEVTVDGQRREIVVGINNILNMPVKYWNRITKYNPIDSSNRGLQVIKNLAKWEVHPIYRIWFWDISENRRSFGSGMNVYDTEANPAIQFAQISKYVIGQSFRFFGQTMDAVGEGEMTDKERREQEKIYDSALSGADKMLFWALGYKYIRQPLEERQAIMMKALQKELTTRIFQYARKYEGEELEKRKEGLERWARKSEEWIKNDMK